MKMLLISGLLLAFALPAAADVQIRLKDVTGQSSTISSNGSMVRIDTGQQYFLIDYRAGQFKMVDPSRGQVMTSSLAGGGSAANAGSGVKVDFKSKGGGQKIAGYSTKKYQFSADGEPCGTIYASSKLMKDPGVRSMFESMRTMQQKSREMMGGFGGLLSPCQQANLQMANSLAAIGAPMKVLDERGQLMSEVLSVDTRKNLPGNYYDAPADLKVVDLDETIAGVKEQTQQIMENMPDINEIMEQMQQDGSGMSEEMQQQMQKQMDQMQKMLQQLQQQQQ